MKTIKDAPLAPTTATKEKKSLKEKLAAKSSTKAPDKNPTKASTKDTDARNIKDTVTKAVSQNREVKYIYPDDVTTMEQKKKHRQATRNKDKSYIKEIQDLKKAGKPTAKLDKEYKQFRKERFLVP